MCWHLDILMLVTTFKIIMDVCHSSLTYNTFHWKFMQRNSIYLNFIFVFCVYNYILLILAIVTLKIKSYCSTHCIVNLFVVWYWFVMSWFRNETRQKYNINDAIIFTYFCANNGLAESLATHSCELNSLTTCEFFTW